jgi:hypothetical protein
MDYVKLVLPFLKDLGVVLKNLFLGFFLMKAGAEKQQLKDLKKEQKNVEEVKNITNSIDVMSDTELDELLLDTRDSDTSNK